MPSVSKSPFTTIASAWLQRCTSVSARSSGGAGFVGNGMTRPRLVIVATQYNAGAMLVSVGVVGDFDPGSRPHRAAEVALAHAAAASGIAIDVRWVPTGSPTAADAVARLDAFDGFWIAPGSPYRSLDGALRAIRFARERDWPLVAT
jgi:CTP synthase (UTP-ammonia lyase)